MGKRSFYQCNKLEEINFSIDSKFEVIEEELLYDLSIKTITIPSNITQIKKNAFGYCNMLEQVFFSSDSKLEIIDDYSFYNSSILEITIPKEVKIIRKYAFYGCNLGKFKIESGSKLQTIDEYLFEFSNVNDFEFPSQLITIGKNAFWKSHNIQRIKFEKDSKLDIIEKEAFCETNIVSIEIPSSITKLKNGWCCYMPKLTEINVSPENQYFISYENKYIFGKISKEQLNFSNLVLCARNVNDVIVPNFIKHICSYSFQNCKINRIEFPNDSKLMLIDDLSFFSSSIRRIRIPKNVLKIGKIIQKFPKLMIMHFIHLQLIASLFLQM